MKLKLPGEPFQTLLLSGMDELIQEDISSRIWKKDHTVWKPDPQEITNRLGWLTIADRMKEALPRLERLADEVRRAGIEKVYLLGMGGSSLAPEVFSKTFPGGEISLEVVDSTHPDYLNALRDRITPETTLFLVATKSGSTVETLSFFKTFYNLMMERVGEDQAGKHFIGITDPGSRLEDLAEAYQFRDLFLNDPEIGGRYSVLSYFGLVPARLLGIDVEQLLDAARTMSERCRMDPSAGQNPGVLLGNALGVLAANGRDKVTFFSSPEIASFPNWTEQLLAESTGKEGRGILPVVEKAPGAPDVYGNDRVFVFLSLGEEEAFAAAQDALEKTGQPVIRIEIDDTHQLGGQFFLWEMATAIAGYHLEINPFNQPNVESAKDKARGMMSAYQEHGQLPEGEMTSPDPDILDAFLNTHLESGSYLAVQAYLPPRDELTTALHRFQNLIRDRCQRTTTVGYGPRYLHSTGQLHKGDSGQGLFLQLISRPANDLEIPQKAGEASSSVSFGTLIHAQALGDAQALRDGGRNVLSFQLGDHPLDELELLLNKIRRTA